MRTQSLWFEVNESKGETPQSAAEQEVRTVNSLVSKLIFPPSEEQPDKQEVCHSHSVRGYCCGVSVFTKVRLFQELIIF